ncbi:hypothetical protein [Thalassotalea eurytherma]|uniref:SCP2 domain-containing protein n=1 Tax=Thalassotalea eurytherma TaxID=1144278 RepID=A0ABQ6H2E8_9GAMM|nr:hypothetical protein [Thalassotalea eurytherma]GLX81290.1 hypothetical protein theurythT_07420 [Thalassotalea eurytherma]
MKKSIIKAALAVIPKSLQYKALIKAVNFLLPPNKQVLNSGIVLKLNVYDMKKSWLIEISVDNYIESAMPVEDIELRASFDTLIACKERSVIETSLKNGDILILGEPALCEQATNALLNISQNQLDRLMKQFLIFFKLKKATRSKAESPLDDITLNDLKTAKDIDALRDEAIRLESTDIVRAHKFMALAHQARPGGPLIKQKLDSYQALLPKS